jgi:starvation-inducible DNA-binding protein
LETQPQIETHPTLSHDEQQEIGEELQATLVELIDLALLGKQLHWSVVGPQFRPLHLQLDELVDSWHTLSDAVAERAVAVGHWPDGQAAAVAKVAGEPMPVGAIAGDEVVHVLTRRLLDTTASARARMDRLGELDQASQDLLIEVVRALEKQLWMVRVQAAG